MCPFNPVLSGQKGGAEVEKTPFAKAMDDSGMKAEEIAYRTGVSVSYLYKLRRGEQRPSLDVAERLAGLLGASVDIFLRSPCPERTNRSARAI